MKTRNAANHFRKEDYYMDNWEAIRLDLGMIAGFLYGILGSFWAVPYLLIIKPIIEFFKKLFQ